MPQRSGRSTAEQTGQPDISHPCSPHSSKGSFNLEKAPPRLQCRGRSGFLLAAPWSCHQSWVIAKGALSSHPWRMLLRRKLRAQLWRDWGLHLQTQPRTQMLQSWCGVCRAAQQILRHSKAERMLRAPPHSRNSRSTTGVSVMLRSRAVGEISRQSTGIRRQAPYKPCRPRTGLPAGVYCVLHTVDSWRMLITQ